MRNSPLHRAEAVPLPPTECVREVVAVLEQAEGPAKAACRRFAAALREVEVQGAAGLTIDKALGLSPSQWRHKARRQRDDKIIEARSRFLADMKLMPAAERIARVGLQLRRLRSGDGLVRALREAAAYAPIPTSGREIWNILRPHETTT